MIFILMFRDVVGLGKGGVSNREMSEVNCFMWELNFWNKFY